MRTRREHGYVDRERHVDAPPHPSVEPATVDDVIAEQRLEQVQRRAYGDPQMTTERIERTRHTVDPVYGEAMTDRQVTTRYLESMPARVNAVFFAILAALEGLLALRFVFAAYGASRVSGFVNFIYDVSWPFMRPFSNAFTNHVWDRGIIEYNTLLAMGVYLMLFLLAGLLINAALPRFEEGGTVVRRRRVTHM